MRRALVLLLLLLVGGCSSCRKSGGAVATLIELDGTVETQRKTDDAPWAAAAKDEAYRIGDAVRTASDATARLRLARKGTLDLDPETVVRFRRTAGDSLDLGVEAGAVELEAGELELVLDTAAGPARIQGGGRARVTAADGETRLEVLVGSVILEGKELTAGMTMEIAMGGAILEDEPIEPPPPPPDAAPPAGPGAGPALVDVVVEAGESATIHDPSPPTAVAVTFDCPDAGHLEVAAGKKKGWDAAAVTSGQGRASAELPAGTRRYRVKCGDKVVGDGKLVVEKDAARKQLPSRPPRNVVDADGRKYTVLYQNRLPEVVLRWIDAPPADSFVIHLETGKKTKTFAVKTARHALDSGDLREGNHTFWVQGGGRKSPKTTIEIAFDNAAAAIYLKRVAVEASKVEVEGAAIRDTTVSLEGDRVELDDQLRFSARTTVGEGRRHAALRIAHRSGGVHYYVLRGGAP